MASVLLKALSFLMLIFVGYALKRAGVFGPKDYRVLVKIVMTLTLPAAAVVSFSGLVLTPALLVMTLLGLGANLLLVLLGWLASRKKDPATKAFCMLNFSGYNIGAFAMPYMQSFLGPMGVAITCLFDAGNAVMCTGGSYAITTAVLRGSTGNAPTLKSTLKALFSSVPFDTYLMMILLALLRLPVPSWALTLLAPLSAANAGLAMLMIGMMFEWNPQPGYLRAAAGAVLTRNLFAGAVALFFYFCTPFSLEIRQVAAIVLFAPISVVSPAFTEKCGGDTGLAGLTNSLSVLVGLGMMTGLILLMGVA